MANTILPPTEYWIKRSEQNFLLQEKKAEEYILTLLKSYQEVKSNIEKELSVFYQRYAVNNKINYGDAQKLLNKSELSKFKDSLDEYIKEAKLYSNDPTYIKKLENMSIRSRIRRIEALKTSIEQQIEILTSNNDVNTGELLKDVYSDNYYRSIWTVQTGFNFGLSFDKLNDKLVEKVVKTRWLGENYSDRIYKDKDKLIRTLETELSQSFIRGDSSQNTAKRIYKRLDISYKSAKRLIRTESNHISNESQADGYISSGIVTEYEFLSTLDDVTTHICQVMDSKVFKLSERQVGINFPPMLPNCRSTTIVHFSNEITPERIARDSKGKSYYVNGDMNYKEWYAKYVKKLSYI